MIENKNGLISKLDPAEDAPELTEEWFDHADLYRGITVMWWTAPAYGI